jgi:cell division protein FtsQ
VPSLRGVVLAGALVLLAAGLYLGARSTSVFAVRTIEVRGASPATARDVRAALASVEGQSLLALDGEDVIARVRRIPEVASAGYDRAFPNTLVLFVREERAAAVVRRGADGWLVAASGRVLRPVRRGARSALPRIWLPQRTDVTVGDELASATAAAAVAAVARVPAAFPARIRDVRVGPAELTLKLSNGFELRLGDGTDVPLKLAIAGRILPSLTADGIAPVAYLDVSVVERPVAGGTLKSEVEVES